MSLYHVTFTKNVPGIVKRGLLRYRRKSNWIKTSGERYGNGEIFVFENETDAWRWAGKMDWEFHKATGTGKISIIKLAAEGKWESDDADPISHAGSKGRWLKSVYSVPPDHIESTYPVTRDVLRKLMESP